jgi:NAD(P)-dependent dehydrogenase (short-subunit alcohol dehydrogenase family)
MIAEAGGRARFIAADLSDSADITRLASDAGDVEVLVNNAGFSLFGPTADIAAERFDALFASNVRAPFLLVAAIGPAMASRGAGSIVNVSSMAGRIGLNGAAAYGASKAALESMTRAWAVEFSPTVRVNAVAAGPVYTEGAAPERTTARCHHAAQPRGRRRGDRRGRCVPCLAASELRDRRRDGRRRGTYCRLTQVSRNSHPLRLATTIPRRRTP